MAIPFKVSDESLNSYGFWVKTDGIDLSGFPGVMLYDHDRNGKLPIGLWENIRRENGELLMDANFDLDDDFAKSVKGKVEKGIIKGASIALNVLEQSSDPKLMKPGQRRPTVTKCSLTEVSVTPFPSNRNAIRLMVNGKAVNLASTGSASDEIELNEILPIINNRQTMKEVALKLGLAEGADEAMVVGAVKTLQDEVTALKTKLISAFAKLGEATGAITNENRDRMLKLAQTDFDLALSFLTPTTPNPSQGGESTPPEPSRGSDLRLSDLIKELKSIGSATEPEKDYDWYQKNDPVSLNTMREKEPEKFQKLFNEFYTIKA